MKYRIRKLGERWCVSLGGTHIAAARTHAEAIRATSTKARRRRNEPALAA